MATELEKAVKNLNRALSQASEVERSEFLEQNFQPDQFELPAKEAPASGWKTFFSRLGRILAAAFWIFFRILLWLLKAPFFILSFTFFSNSSIVIVFGYKSKINMCLFF